MERGTPTDNDRILIGNNDFYKRNTRQQGERQKLSKKTGGRDENEAGQRESSGKERKRKKLEGNMEGGKNNGRAINKKWEGKCISLIKKRKGKKRVQKEGIFLRRTSSLSKTKVCT